MTKMTPADAVRYGAAKALEQVLAARHPEFSWEVTYGAPATGTAQPVRLVAPGDHKQEER